MKLTRFLIALAGIFALAWLASAADDNPFEKHGKLRVAKSSTHLEHADGTPFFFLADTVWTGPALSTAKDWQTYLADRKKKRFTAIQFNVVSPWRTAPTDASGRTAYEIKDGKLIPNVAFFDQVEARVEAINDAGLLAVPVLAWALKKGDAGFDLTEEQIITIVKYELGRLKKYDCLYILAGDARYNPAERWKKIGRAVFADHPGLLVTTHPTGMNFPWKGWEDEKWLNVLGYQSGHGDDANTLKWIHSGPAAEFGKAKDPTRPIINLEPPYEDHRAYQSKKPHTAYSVRRAVYWSLLATPVAGFTYGGNGVWSWHTKPGEPPTDHANAGPAKVWSEALQLPGASQMGYVRSLFEQLPWTELRPAQQCVEQKSGKNDPALFVSCAAAEKAGLYVFYFPAGATATIVLHIRGGADRMRWFNPRDGKWFEPTDAKPGRGLQPPDEEDWILVVKP